MRSRNLLTALAVGVCVVVSAYAADIAPYPVPWVPGGSKTRMGNSTDGIRFANVPAQGEISIYTLTGELVTHFEFNDTKPAQWLGKNDQGKDVGSGVYLWVVKGGGATKTGKLIVIR